MQTPLFVRRLSLGERHQFEVGLRSADAFVPRWFPTKRRIVEPDCLLTADKIRSAP